MERFMSDHLLLLCDKCGLFLASFGYADCPVCNNSMLEVTELPINKFLLMSKKEAEDYAINLLGHGFDEKLKEDRIYYLANRSNQSNSAVNKNVSVSCPYCHSTNTKKISSLSKAGSIALFGIFGLGKSGKQWHCNHCGSDF